MSTLLPILALVMALCSAFVTARDTEVGREGGRDWSAPTVLAVVAIALAALAVWRQGYSQDAWYAAIGFGIGLVPSGGRSGSVTFAIAAAAAVAGVMSWLPEQYQLSAQLGLVGGAAFGAWIWSKDGRQVPPLYATAVACAVAVDVLGGKGGGAGFALTGSLLATLGAAAMLARDLGGKLTRARALSVGVGLLAIGAWVIGQRYLGMRDIWVLFVLGVLVGTVVHWLLPERSEQVFPVLVAIILWIGVATVGFALRKGFGMSLGLLGGVLSLAVLGNRRAILTAAPLAALVAFRLFREAHTDATGALDVGQHYSMIGLVIGAALVLLPIEWMRARAGRQPMRQAMAAAFWAAALVLATITTALLMGPKGVVGLLVGLGLGGVLELLRGGASLQPLSLGLGLAAGTTLVYGWLGDQVLVTRDEKMQLLLPLVGGFALLAALIYVSSPKTRSVEA